MTEPPVSFDELREHLNLDASEPGDNDELWSMLLAATGLVESFVGAMVSRTVTDTVRSSSLPLLLPQSPVMAVESVARLAASDGPSLAGAGTVYPSGYNDITPRYQVTYTIGRDPIPEDLKLATLIVARQLYDTQRSGAAVAFTNMVGQETQIPMGFAVPRRAAELMAPHRHITVG